VTDLGGAIRMSAWHAFYNYQLTVNNTIMLEPEQLKELKTRLDSLGKKGKKSTTDAVHLLRNDLKLILDMHDGPEKTALEQRFMQGLLQAEDAT
jgi:hypothetical protein